MTAAMSTATRAPDVAHAARPIQRAVLGVLAGALLVAGFSVGEARTARPPGGGPLTSSGSGLSEAPAPVSAGVHVVQPGDTLWSIARTVQPEGDVRPIVEALAKARGADPLTVGERIALPSE